MAEIHSTSFTTRSVHINVYSNFIYPKWGFIKRTVSLLEVSSYLQKIQTMKLTRIILGSLLVIGSTQFSSAQGKLSGLKNKLANVGQPNTGGDQKQITEDSTSTVLESKTYSKDGYNISGIYYSSKPMMYDARNEGEKDQTFKKFLLTYDEKMGAIVFTNRLSTGMDYSSHKYHTFFFGSSSGLEEKLVAFSKGVISNEGGSTNSGSYYYYDINTNSSYEMQKGVTKYNVSGVYLTQLEPGVFAMHTLIVLAKSLKTCEGPSFYSTDNDSQTYNLIFQEGKDISKWTPEAIKAKIFELRIKHCQIVNGAEAANAELPATVSSIKDAPSKADMLAAAKARAAQYNYTETIKDARLMQEWTGIYENLGPKALRTLVARRTNFVVTMTNEKGGCSYEIMILEQKNNYQIGSLDENYGGIKVEAVGNGPNTQIDCSKTN